MIRSTRIISARHAQDETADGLTGQRLPPEKKLLFMSRGLPTILPGNVYRSFFADHGYLDLAGKGHFRLDLLGDLKG